MNVPLAIFCFASLLCSVASGLECYSCDSYRTDQDCNDIKTLPKVTCPALSESSPIGMSCGFQHIQASSGSIETERIFRGCVVAGECDLLGKQAGLTSRYRLTSCQECATDACNEMRTGSGATGGMRGSMAVLSAVVALVVVRGSLE
ncbi:hypothetical protein quinque_012402 [Culex quinquefasciatus]